MFRQSSMLSKGTLAQKQHTTIWRQIWPSCGNYDQMTRSQYGTTVKFVMLELPEGRNLCSGKKKLFSRWIRNVLYWSPMQR